MNTPSPEVQARIDAALKAGNQGEALRLCREEGGLPAEEAAVFIEECVAHLQGKKTPSSVALGLANDFRDGKLTESQAYSRMRALCPGFSSKVYSKVWAQALFESR
jgi:hypothetical protein